MKIDFGSGYNPKKGYLTCDITKSPYLDTYFDYKNQKIIGCEKEKVKEFYTRNTLHHIEKLEETLTTLKDYLEVNGKLEIIEVRKEFYKQNYFLDNLWYRGIIKRNEIWFSKEYRDYKKILENLNFELLESKLINEKEITIWKKRG